jgi:hypothetical protein
MLDLGWYFPIDYLPADFSIDRLMAEPPGYLVD